jgi:hypothetical protein
VKKFQILKHLNVNDNPHPKKKKKKKKIVNYQLNPNRKEILHLFYLIIIEEKKVILNNKVKVQTRGIFVLDEDQVTKTKKEILLFLNIK